MKLLVPAVLRRYCGGEAHVDVEGDTVAQALHDLFARHSAMRARVLDEAGRLHPYLLLYRNDEPAALESELQASDTVEIVAAAVGG